MNEQYLFFAGRDYYPNGGWGDFKGAADTLEAAYETLLNTGDIDWWEIVHKGEIIKEGRRIS